MTTGVMTLLSVCLTAGVADWVRFSLVLIMSYADEMPSTMSAAAAPSAGGLGSLVCE